MKKGSIKINRKKFLAGIILPSVLTLLLFLVSTFGFVIPYFEQSLVNAKKEMIREIVFSAISVIEKISKDAGDGLSEEEIMERAAQVTGSIRYGTGNKDYLWITDLKPVMVRHPYLPELEGKDLTYFTDANGKRMFVEFVEKTRQTGEAIVEYSWQWMDDSTRIVPKISYVREYEPWGWLIGTGVYIDDIQAEIAGIKRMLLLGALAIFLGLSGLLTIIVRRNLRIEQMRTAAEEGLKVSREKYRALVEASTDGTLLFIDGKCIYANKKMTSLLGDPLISGLSPGLEEIIHPGRKEDSRLIIGFEQGRQSTFRIETALSLGAEAYREVLLTISRADIYGKEGFIYLIRELAGPVLSSTGTELPDIRPALQESSAMGMFTASMRGKGRLTGFSPALPAILGFQSGEALKKMTLFDLVENFRESKELTSYLWQYKKLDGYRISFRKPAGGIAQVRLFARLIKDDLTGEDQVTGIFTDETVFSLKKTEVSDSNGKREIPSEEVALQNCRNLPSEVKALLEEGARSSRITRLATLRSADITTALIERILQELGPPPVKFVFMALGSEARKEQTLLTDQDNAILFEDAGKGNPGVADYFLAFGRRMNDGLEAAGYEKCKGDIMAGNPRWNQSLSVWKSYFAGWIAEATEQNLVDLSVFFDFRVLYGEVPLADELRYYIRNQLIHTPAFFGHLAAANLNYKLPLGLFGRLQVAQGHDNNTGTLNLKNASRVIVNILRLYAMKYGVDETNTAERLQKLFEMYVLPHEVFSDLGYALEFLLLVQYRYQVHALENQVKPDHNINLSILSSIEINTLKNILSTVSAFQNRLKHDFGLVL